MFDQFLEYWSKAHGEKFEPFTDDDYFKYVDGKLRYEGARSFLESRGIVLPQGDADETPNFQTVCGLGNFKDSLVKDAIRSGGVEKYEGSIKWVEQLRQGGLRTAVVSSSSNCAEVLQAAGIADLFDVRVDGVVARELHLAGKPAPDTFLKAAQLLGVPPGRAVVVEDAISGVEAGRRGNFALVIGVDRDQQRDALLAHGADIVVNDLAELLA
ncbi:MAG: hydrolase [Gemmatales bacterium]|nr:MAG: hydrolase [Gemmatales bacterium]